MKRFFLFSFFFCFTLVCYPQKECWLLIGTYTAGKSEGIYVYKFNKQTGQVVFTSVAKTPNPSYLAISPTNRYVYAVNEMEDNKGSGEQGHVSAFAFDRRKGILRYLNQQSSGGVHPCYVTVDKTGKWLIAGNYSSGTVGVLETNKDGSLGNLVQRLEHSGYSVNTARQQGPHVHCTLLDRYNKYLFVPDLGIDKTMIYRFNERTGQLTANTFPFAQSEAGAGPRHFEFHPNGKMAYLVEELNGSVSVFSYTPATGRLDIVQTISLLPHDYMGPAGSADIHVSPDGKFLYASNRGESNTLAIFAINKNGLLHLIGHQSTLGKTPRNFNFDPSGNFLLVANQHSNNVVIFKRDKKTGLLTDTGKRIEVGNPVCLKWIPGE